MITWPQRGTLDLHIDDSAIFLDSCSIQYDAVVTDPPYEIALHGKDWDNTGIAFSPEFWTKIYNVLKPGGYLAAFAAPRKYHHVAVAVENAGFTILPFLQWTFETGLPKPVNLSELFDRENKDRKVVGTKKGSGFTTANVQHGAQQRETTTFVEYERYTTEDSERWKGFYYGVNCMKPCAEPILLAQKPISEKSMVKNIRKHGVGALNLAGLAGRQGTSWSETALSRPKARKSQHGFNHPSVKNVELMKDLCVLCCPPGGKILDPFGGTGTTAEAAIALGFDCTIVEKDEAMRGAILKRCAD